MCTRFLVAHWHCLSVRTGAVFVHSRVSTEAHSCCFCTDAVAGTSKQHVAYDYALRLAAGSAAAVTVENDGVAVLANGHAVAPPVLRQCEAANVSLCSAAAAAGAPGQPAFTVVM